MNKFNKITRHRQVRKMMNTIKVPLPKKSSKLKRQLSTMRLLSAQLKCHQLWPNFKDGSWIQKVRKKHQLQQWEWHTRCISTRILSSRRLVKELPNWHRKKCQRSRFPSQEGAISKWHRREIGLQAQHLTETRMISKTNLSPLKLYKLKYRTMLLRKAD